MSLGQSSSIGPPQEWQVPPCGRGQAEVSLQELLSGGRGQQIIAADNLRDTLSCIIDCDGQLVGRNCAGRPYCKIAAVSGDVHFGGAAKGIKDCCDVPF